MKCEVPLTPEQRLFADEHHDLVYKFLRKKRLSIDEFYDVCLPSICSLLFDRIKAETILLYHYCMEVNERCCIKLLQIPKYSKT